MITAVCYDDYCSEVTTVCYSDTQSEVIAVSYSDHCGGLITVGYTLAFKQALPKMCHSPKVENEVDNKCFFFCDPYFRTIFEKNFKLP